MAITGIPYPTIGVTLFNAGIDVGTDNFAVTLHTSSYTPDVDHAFFSDVTNEVSGTGYSAGGYALIGASVNYDSLNHRTYLTFDNPLWSTATVTYRYAVWRMNTGLDSSSPLLCYTDFGTDQVVVAADIPFTIDLTGLLRLS